MFVELLLRMPSVSVYNLSRQFSCGGAALSYFATSLGCARHVLFLVGNQRATKDIGQSEHTHEAVHHLRNTHRNSQDKHTQHMNKQIHTTHRHRRGKSYTNTGQT